jgi:hypothetical protein
MKGRMKDYLLDGIQHLFDEHITDESSQRIRQDQPNQYLPFCS